MPAPRARPAAPRRADRTGAARRGRSARRDRADVTFAQARRGAACPGAARVCVADDLQRGRHDRGDGAAREVQGQLREDARREARLHVVLRQGVRRCGPASFPGINAEVVGSHIVYKKHYDFGIAVSTPRGLVVPVLRDCDQLSFAGVEKGILELAEQGADRQARSSPTSAAARSASRTAASTAR